MFPKLPLALLATGLTCLSATAHAQESTSAITGGGAQSSEYDYFNEFATFNGSQAAGAATFNNPSPASGNNALYWPSASGAGQTAFLNDDNSCNANKTLGLNNKACSGTVGGSASVDYEASDAPFTSAQIAQWDTSSLGQSAAGNLIQLPSLGVGLAIPVVNSKVTVNGAPAKGGRAPAGGVALTDNDLCGIFSGKINDWSGTSAAAHLAKGPINVVYRSDSSGATFLLLNHFSAVCTTSNSNFAVLPVVANNLFTSLFPPNSAGGSTLPANFTGEGSSGALASYLGNATGVAGAPTVTSAIGYVSPDFTTINPNSNAAFTNGAKSTLVVAGIQNGPRAYIPDVVDITTALNHAQMGSNLTAPNTAAAGTNPANYVPIIQTVSAGYPIVGYSTLGFAQCYASPVITTGILSFLTDHYSGQAAYAASISNNGFVAIAASGAKAFSQVISRAILTNKDKWNANIGNTAVCTKSVIGR